MPVAPLQELSISVTSYPTDAQVDFGFEPDSVTLEALTTTAAEKVYVSLDGITTHYVLTPTFVASLTIRSKAAKKLWLKVATGTVAVAVMAETVR